MPVAPAGTALAGGTDGPRALRPLLDTVLDALTTGAQDRSGPLPPGGPDAVARAVRDACLPLLPEEGTGPHTALRTLVHTLTAGAADPADPHCAAHLHCPPLALAAAADLAASALNPSMDSWDQAPAASELETLTARTLAALVYPEATAPDALVTTGGTESNQLALLLAREAHRTAGPLRIVCGANAHHSIHRAAWLLGLPEPLTLPTPDGTLDPATVHTCLTELTGRSSAVLLTATAGTTDAGAIDPLPALADLADQHGARLHIDASYGGPLLFSTTHRTTLTGLARAHTVTLDLHKLGWQPVAAGLLAVPGPATLTPLAHQADYLNPDDDTEAGLPDLLGRSLRTTRRPDILKIAVTLKALGRQGLGDLVDRTLTAARTLADLIDAHPRYELHSRPTLTTVLFRPTGADDTTLATIRRTLLTEGHAVLGRATTPTGLWLKATLLNPHTQPGDLTTLLKLVEGHTPR
ncbi:MULTISPECIES: aminotransferase class V-fold PLP-dependent enzyme [unclassified Streptomyces]|uniref:pyridoxal phosphate-dependent decarboxylase family protein n=1 Tax=unclassified Streptomyces TaxID=2593676 RepID=UPI00037A8D69|nr:MULTISPECIES: aminotransferase class V-fold PLP-dependent enzyme [unclassified Streptomyces]MYT27906.1 aminotransferase class V-fold PLP-dependent enzyme [Streptomyces sp. SID8354]